MPPKIKQMVTPFSKYTSPFGTYYLHCPSEIPAREVSARLNAGLEGNIFHTDCSVTPPLVYAEKTEYLAWLRENAEEVPIDAELIPQAQIAYLERLKKCLYSPCIHYSSDDISATLGQLAKIVTDESLFELLRIGFQIKIKYLNDALFGGEEPSIEEAPDLSLDEAADKSVEPTHTEIQYQRFIDLFRLLPMKTSRTDFSGPFLQEMAEFCRIVAQFIFDTYGFNREELEHLIKRFIFVLNKAPALRFDQEKNTILIKSKSKELDLFNFKVETETEVYPQYLAKLLYQVFFSLCDIVFYLSYRQLLSSSAELLSLVSTDETVVARTRQKGPLKINATNQLAEGRSDIICSALSTQNYTQVAKSNIEQAGLGLFVQNSRDKLLKIPNGMVISWFHGEIINEADITKDMPQTEFFTIGRMKGTNTPTIRASMDPKHPGNAYFVNHSSNSNAEFKTIRLNGLSLGEALIYSGPDITLKFGERIEMVVNYGARAAETIHGIIEEEPYTPVIHPIPLTPRNSEVARRMLLAQSFEVLDPSEECAVVCSKMSVFPDDGLKLSKEVLPIKDKTQDTLTTEDRKDGTFLPQEMKQSYLDTHKEHYQEHQTADTPYPASFLKFSSEFSPNLLLIWNGGVSHLEFNNSFRKLAPESELRGDSEHRTEVYTSVQVASSTASTKEVTSSVGFPKRSNAVNGLNSTVSSLCKEETKTEPPYEQLPFSPYACAMGKFYFYISDGVEIEPLFSNLQKTHLGKETFFVDRSGSRPLLGAKRENYKTWLENRLQGKERGDIKVPQKQIDYLAMLRRAHYTPCLTYDLAVMEETKVRLKKRLPPEIWFYITAGFETKQRFLEASKEAPGLSLKKELLRVLRGRLASQPDDLLRRKSLSGYCRELIRFSMGLYKCDLSLLPQIINQYFSNTHIESKLTCQDITTGLLHYTALPDSNKLNLLQEFAANVLSLVFCGLSEAVVFYYYQASLQELITRTRKASVAESDAQLSPENDEPTQASVESQSEPKRRKMSTSLDKNPNGFFPSSSENTTTMNDNATTQCSSSLMTD